MKKIIKDYIEDILIIGGCLTAIINTYFLNIYIANYLLALFLIASGIIIAKELKK